MIFKYVIIVIVLFIIINVMINISKQLEIKLNAVVVNLLKKKIKLIKIVNN